MGLQPALPPKQCPGPHRGWSRRPTCPRLPMQLPQHDVEQQEGRLRELGEGVGIGRAPGETAGGAEASMAEARRARSGPGTRLALALCWGVPIKFLTTPPPPTSGRCEQPPWPLSWVKQG